MGLLYIGLSVVFSLSIAHLLKIVRKKEMPIVPVLVVNYFTASLISFAQSDAYEVLKDVEQTTYFFAIGTGCLFIINFFLYSYSLYKNGVGVSIAAMRLSLVFPVLISLFIYNEYLELSNYVGIALVFLSLLLLIPFAKSKSRLTFSATLLLIFFLNGLVDVLLKVYDRELAAALPKELFLFLIFISSALIGVSYLIIKKALKFDRHIVFYGILIGIVNLYSSFFLLLALENLSGAMVFSATNLLNVFFGTLLGVFYWKDHLKPNQYWGLGLAIIAILLLIF